METVQDLIDKLMQVKDKTMSPAVCIKGVEISETTLCDILEEKDIGVCWLMLNENSSIHQD